MKRLDREERTYRYTTEKEAEQHIKEMEVEGWEAMESDDVAPIIYEAWRGEYCYTVHFIK